jgi:hypothetical protein
LQKKIPQVYSRHRVCTFGGIISKNIFI